MATIDEAAERFSSFFDAEAKLLIANLDGAESFDKLKKQMQSMLDSPATFEFEREDVSELSDHDKKANENAKKAVAPRQLFLVEQYDIGKRRLFCGYASNPRRPKNYSRYAMAFWADDSLQIIATYMLCSTCEGLGQVGGSECSDCGGRGWLHQTGERKLKFEKPSAVKKLDRPNWPQSAEHYDSR